MLSMAVEHEAVSDDGRAPITTRQGLMIAPTIALLLANNLI